MIAYKRLLDVCVKKIIRCLCIGDIRYLRMGDHWMFAYRRSFDICV